MSTVTAVEVFLGGAFFSAAVDDDGDAEGRGETLGDKAGCITLNKASLDDTGAANKSSAGVGVVD